VRPNKLRELLKSNKPTLSTDAKHQVLAGGALGFYGVS
jgi:hypothetical protein